LDEVQALTSNNLLTFLLVLVALATLFILFFNVVEAVHKLKKPQENKENNLMIRQGECEKRFARDYRVLDEHTRRIEDVEETNHVLCAGIHALLEHELHNGNSDEMRAASEALFKHLNK
jgi:hypothetical protein